MKHTFKQNKETLSFQQKGILLCKAIYPAHSLMTFYLSVRKFCRHKVHIYAYKLKTKDSRHKSAFPINNKIITIIKKRKEENVKLNYTF